MQIMILFAYMSSLETKELNTWYWYSQTWLATIILKYKNAWNLYSVFPLLHGSNKGLKPIFQAYHLVKYFILYDGQGV